MTLNDMIDDFRMTQRDIVEELTRDLKEVAHDHDFRENSMTERLTCILNACVAVDVLEYECESETIYVLSVVRLTDHAFNFSYLANAKIEGNYRNFICESLADAMSRITRNVLA